MTRRFEVHRIRDERGLHQAYLASIEEVVALLEPAFQRTFLRLPMLNAMALATLRKVMSYASAYRKLCLAGHLEEAACLSRVVMEAWANLVWTTKHEGQEELKIELLGYNQAKNKRERLAYAAKAMKGDVSDSVKAFLRQTRGLEDEKEAIRARHGVNEEKLEELREKRIEDRFTEIGFRDLHQRLYRSACSPIHSDADSLQAFMTGERDAMRFMPPTDVQFLECYDDIVYALLLDTAQRVNKLVPLLENLEAIVDHQGARRDALLHRWVEIEEGSS